MELIQSVPLKSIHNARELGGYKTAGGRTVKSGVLLRTASLHGISDEDIYTLTDVFRVEHIIDFRMPMELENAEDRPINGAQHHHLNVIDLSAMDSQDLSQADISKFNLVQMVELSEQVGMQDDNMYIGFLTTETGKKAFSDFFHILLSADPDRAVLWHCTSGKDRTGLAAMLLLSALGAEESVVISDYLLTNEYNRQRIEGTRQFLKAKGCDDELIEKAIIVFDAVKERFMRNAVAYLKKNYGSVTGYIREELNVSQEEIEQLKEKYLI